MNRPIVFFGALLFLSMAGSVAISVVAQPLMLQDVQKNGTNLSYFQKVPSVLNWNFKRGGASYSSATRSLVVGAQTAEYNPDQGTVQAQTGIVVGSTTAKPTCTAARRGEFYTQFATTDAGDLTYQCCHSGALGYSWVAVACQ